MNISIIVPTLNEEAEIDDALSRLDGIPDLEIIVADGGSIDRTIALVKTHPVTLLPCPPGRGSQLNHGAAAASGEVFLFLHCDTRLPEDFLFQIRDTLDQADTVAGAFPLSIDDTAPLLRVVERSANLRAAYLGLIYGDQAIFVKRNFFFKAGGFPDQPLMEDFALVRRLGKLGRIRLASSPVSTSARRWKAKGIVRTTLLNQMILILYLAGVSPNVLAGLYYGKR